MWDLAIETDVKHNLYYLIAHEGEGAFPTAVDSTWLSKSIGGETIILPSNHADFPPGTRTLYIGVRSRKDKCIFSISVDIKDRKNKFGNLRLRRDDYAGLHDMEHETWKAFD